MNEQTKQKLMNFLKRFWILIIFCLVMLVGVFILIEQQSELNAVKQRNEQLSSEVNKLEKQCENLEGELSFAGSDSYSEDAARDKLGWVKEDEIVFKEGDEATGTDEASKTPEPSQTSSSDTNNDAQDDNKQEP